MPHLRVLGKKWLIKKGDVLLSKKVDKWLLEWSQGGGAEHLLNGLEGDFTLDCLEGPTGDCFVSHIFALLIFFPVFFILCLVVNANFV